MKGLKANMYSKKQIEDAEENFVANLLKEIDNINNKNDKKYLADLIDKFLSGNREEKRKIIEDLKEWCYQLDSTNRSSNVRSSSQSGSQSICSTNRSSNVRSSSQSVSQSICSTNRTSSPYNLDPFGGSTSLRLQQADLQKKAIEQRQKRYNNFGRKLKEDCNSNSPNQTSISVCNGYPRNPNISGSLIPNIGNGESHCYLAATLGIITLIPGLTSRLNQIFRINLNRDWNSALYYSIQFKLNENEGLTSNNTDESNFGDPLGFLGFLERYNFFKYKQFLFNTMYELESGLAKNDIELNIIVGIIFSEGTFRGENLITSKLQDSNINHWKSLIKTESDFYLFDSIQGGYKPDVRYSFHEAFVMLLNTPIYIIYK